MGYAAAMSVVLFVLSFLIAVAVFRWSRRWVHYDTM
jgi:ABC-type sugar transport system permease subunit